MSLFYLTIQIAIVKTGKNFCFRFPHSIWLILIYRTESVNLCDTFYQELKIKIAISDCDTSFNSLTQQENR